ncbi:sugar transferase [Oceanidesulfovibrio indonesiensis]|uniref:sugar transferase n=1 Tax=Oceanidesulfovibrio indonesiensis TaxID=54767 RepID=UPI001F43CDE2|nr:sugar transferase [Oceanidesulfovibrio indonesiensis]
MGNSPRYPLDKRAFDVLATLALAPVWMPLLALASAGVLIVMGRPVFFRQQRPGLGGVIFTMYKLRTMRPCAECGEAALPSDAQRITPLGRFLRRTSLDELPEFLHVLAGRMSLVGPRPLLPEYLPRYTERQARRHELPPGITGLAQTSGRRDLSWEETFELDVWYVENRTMRLDIAILVRTIGQLFRRGAGEAADRGPFTGSEPSETTRRDTHRDIPPDIS